MTTAQVVETSVTVNNNSPIQDYLHPDDQTQPTFEMTPGLKPFTVKWVSWHCTGPKWEYNEDKKQEADFHARIQREGQRQTKGQGFPQ